MNAQLAGNQNEHYSRLWSLKLLFIPEKACTAQETPDESEKDALRVFCELLGLRHTTLEYLDTVHRIGEKREGRNRPIIVRFVSRKTRLEVLRIGEKREGRTRPIIVRFVFRKTRLEVLSKRQ